MVKDFNFIKNIFNLVILLIYLTIFRYEFILDRFKFFNDILIMVIAKISFPGFFQLLLKYNEPADL